MSMTWRYTGNKGDDMDNWQNGGIMQEDYFLNYKYKRVRDTLTD